MELGEKIQISRKKKGMSQEDLANVLNVSRQAVQKWESGVSNPELNKVIELGRVLDVSLDWLLSEKDQLKTDVVDEEETEDSLEEIAPAEEETKNEPRKDSPVLEKPKHSLKKVFIIGSIALLLVGGGVAATIIGMNSHKEPVDKVFQNGSQTIVVEGYEKTEVVDGVSYALGNTGVVKSLYIVGVNTTNPSFLAEYNGYFLDDMLFGTFNDRKDFVSVTIPECDLFETIGASTLNFSGCTKLEEVNLPDNLETIGDETFRGCSSLKEISFPSSLKSLGKYAFMSCSSLEDITFEGTKKKWESITKGALIWDHVPANVVHCSNGDVPLDK